MPDDLSLFRADYRRQRVPRQRYLSAAFQELEWDRMWTRVWLLACRERDVPRVGDVWNYEIGTESFLIVRQPDGTIRAFSNVCRHRGTRLCSARMTSLKTVRCPYHGWEWKLDGELLRITDGRSFSGLAREELSLHRVRCDTWGGFVWITMDPQAAPLEEFLAETSGLLAPYRLGDATLIRDVTVEWACNWKLSIENGDEAYHVQSIHPQLVEVVDDLDVAAALYREHSSFVVKFGAPHPRHGRTTIGPELAGMMRKTGLDPATFTGDLGKVREAMLRSHRAQLEGAGITFPGLDDAALLDNLHVHLFPATMFNVLLPGYWLFRMRPHPTDPQRSYFDFQEFQFQSPGAPLVERPRHEFFSSANVALDSVLDEDAALLPRVQQGLASRTFEGNLFGDQEVRLIHLHEVLDRYCFGPRT